MRKTYQMILALALLMLGVTNAMGQKIYRAELDKSMFKAWDSNQPGANEVANPENEPKDNQPFGCATNLYTTVGEGGAIYGTAHVSVNNGYERNQKLVSFSHVVKVLNES